MEDQVISNKFIIFNNFVSFNVKAIDFTNKILYFRELCSEFIFLLVSPVKYFKNTFSLPTY